MVQEKGKHNPLQVLKKAVELCMPNLRHYYRMTRKAQVVASYASKGSYYADVQPLRNDETVDSREPLVPKVAIPVMWGGKKRGVVCPPEVGSLCDLSYYDGDPNYPFISNIRWGAGYAAPSAKLKEFVIQYENGVEIRIDEQQHIITLTPQTVRTEAGKNWTIRAGSNATIEAGDSASITATGTLTLRAPNIIQQGNVTTKGVTGSIDGEKGTVTEYANRTQNGSLVINGDVSIVGNLSTSGNSSAGSRSGGDI